MYPILLTIGTSIDKVFYGFDMWVFHFFGSMQSTFLTYVAKFFTTFGDEAFVIPVLIVGIVLCFFKRTRKYGFTLLFAIIIGTIVTNVIAKPMALRIRPYNTLQDNADYWSWYIVAGSLSESDYSFPSGHTTAAFELATAMFLCLFCKRKRTDGTYETPSSKQKKIAFVFPIIALCTMGSRVYLMVHYASDVLFGLIIGALSGAVAFLLMKLVVHLIEKATKFNDFVDLERIFKNGINDKIGILCIAVVVVGITIYAFIPSLSEGGADTVRCAYADESYSCYNAAKVDDPDYPAIDGKNYCKIHWKQLMGETK